MSGWMMDAGMEVLVSILTYNRSLSPKNQRGLSSFSKFSPFPSPRTLGLTVDLVLPRPVCPELPGSRLSPASGLQ